MLKIWNYVIAHAAHAFAPLEVYLEIKIDRKDNFSFISQS